jgi:hypothetical protein
MLRVISTPSFHLPCKKTIRIDRAVYAEAKASLIVWKFFRDLDIFDPEMDKCLSEASVIIVTKVPHFSPPPL